MWIRNQNRMDLENVQDVYIRLIQNKQCTINTGRGHILGQYSTKEKALRVLDGIENHIVMMEDNYVYQMPQDEDVN